MSKKLIHYDHLPVKERKHHYSIIYADVPLKYDNVVDKAHGGPAYSLLTTQQICALDVKSLANPKGCLLFMWCFMPKIPQILEIMNAWGFKYVSCVFMWLKMNRKSTDTYFSVPANIIVVLTSPLLLSQHPSLSSMNMEPRQHGC